MFLAATVPQCTLNCSVYILDCVTSGTAGLNSHVLQNRASSILGDPSALCGALWRRSPPATIVIPRALFCMSSAWNLAYNPRLQPEKGSLLWATTNDLSQGSNCLVRTRVTYSRPRTDSCGNIGEGPKKRINTRMVGNPGSLEKTSTESAGNLGLAPRDRRSSYK